VADRIRPPTPSRSRASSTAWAWSSTMKGCCGFLVAPKPGSARVQLDP